MKKSEALRGLRAARESNIYDAEVVSTPEGRESNRLRLQGQRLMAGGRTREALHLFQQALACHPDTDDSAAAASARHDLAHVLSEGGLATPWGLTTAEALFRKALRSPSRLRAKFRRAQTKSALAVCLRQLIRSRGEAPELLKEIEHLYRDAIADLEDCGGVAFHILAMVHQNLANFLCGHRDDVNQALFHYERAVSNARKHERLLNDKGKADEDTQRILSQSRLTAAQLLSQRKQKRDLAQAEQLANEVLRDRDPASEDSAKLTLALVVLEGDAPDRIPRAQQWLAQVRLERLANREQWIDLARALRRAEATDAALLRLRQYINEGIVNRARNTIADFMADAAALSFQSAAALAARIYAEDKQDPLQSFLVLENTSGMRFGEMISEYTWRPETPRARALRDERSRQNHLTFTLDTFARGMEPLTAEEQRQGLAAVLAARERTSSPDDDFIWQCLQRASQEQVPVRHLDRLVQEGLERAARVFRALAQVDAGFAHSRRLLGAELVPQDLEELLREHAGHVLVRLDIQEDLLVAAVWFENGKLMARHACMPISFEIFSLLARAAENLEAFTVQDHERLSAQLAALDLSAALPAGPLNRIVLLPSNLAAQLPLVALGPPGSRLIDRAHSTIWLPCVYPLRIRPAPIAPRTGDVVAIPSPQELKYVDLALAPPSATEQHLMGAAASGEALSRATREARTLCLITHGYHAPGESPLLRMAHGKDEPLAFTDELLGIERVEIWACESGAHRSSDPLTPPANEAFGLDFQLLLQNGARTAIGTLWSVPQISTSALVRRFRWLVQSGEDPARALAEAQRWWLLEGLPLMMRLIREKASAAEGLAAFAHEICAAREIRPPRPPMSRGAPPLTVQEEAALHHYEVSLSSAISWAGIRFVGIPGQVLAKEWIPIEDRPLNADEQAELQRLLSPEPSPSTPHLDERQDLALERAMALELSASPSPSQALEVARRLRERLNSSHSDNLLAALAWLHEALAAPGLAEEERIRLSIEAAHLWLDLSWGELPIPFSPEPVTLARASKLLQSLPQDGDLDVRTALARHQLLRRLQEPVPLEERLRIVQETVDSLAGLLHRAPLEGGQSLRALTVFLELLALCPPEFRAAHGKIVERARALANGKPGSAVLDEAWQRMLGALAHHHHDKALAPRALTFFTPRELLFASTVLGRELQPIPGTLPYAEFMDRALSRLEGGLWGYSSDDGASLVLTTGTPGEAYRRLLQYYLESHAQHNPNEAGAELACLQYACDLRLTFLHRLVRLSGAVSREEDPFSLLWQFLSARRMLLLALSDAARMPDLPAPEGTTLQPHPLDPFALSGQQLRERSKDLTCLTAWSLDQCCESMRHGPPIVARTAAFEAIRRSQLLETTAHRAWTNILAAEEQVRTAEPEAPSLAALLSNNRDLQQNAKALHSLPEGEAVLGLSLLNLDAPLLMACWNDGTGQHRRVVRLATAQLSSGLSQLLTFHADDESPHRGRSNLRRAGWTALEEALGPALEALLHQAQRKRKLRWRLLAPGALRPLPLLGLRVGGVPLASQVESLSHLPSLGFASFTSSRKTLPKFTACLLVRTQGAEGLTAFGGAAVETLRHLHAPQLVLDCRTRRGTELPEADALQAHARRIHTLRLYSTGSPWSLNPTTAHLRLEGEQGLREWNLRVAPLPHCDTFELWASTASLHTPDHLLRDSTDRIPGLAAGFLANGAAAVIDLAWPVHDVVKALVCEQYGLLREKEGHGPARLALAISRTSELLNQLGSRGPYQTTREVLERIDELRQITSLQRFNIDPRHLTPFANHARALAIDESSGDELVEELRQPVHLGAFRWWGS